MPRVAKAFILLGVLLGFLDAWKGILSKAGKQKQHVCVPHSMATTVVSAPR